MSEEPKAPEPLPPVHEPLVVAVPDVDYVKKGDNQAGLETRGDGER